jgi:predicted lipoprotein with Yx(FWY)xxD motif
VRKTIFTTTLAVGALTLAACATGSSGTGSSNAGGSSTTAGSSSAAPAAELATAKTSLGTVVVDGRKRTVYEFDKDTVGAATSACTGVCVGLWPELTTTSSSPSVSGLSGTVGTAPTTGGAQQLTLNGHRLYTFSGDSQSGQVNGEAFMNLWWVLSPAGQLIKSSAGAPSSSSSSAPGYTY